MSQPPRSVDDLVVFLTGNELGSLRPCGCSGGQLGGLEKRSAVFNEAPAARRLVLETGSLVPGESEQDQMKFRILFEAFGLLGYDAVHLTTHDYETASRLGVFGDPQPPFRILHGAQEGRSAVFTKRVTVEGRDITVNVVSFDSPAAVLRSPPLAPGPQDALTINILILDYDPHLLEGYPRDLLFRSWQSPGAECVVCPSKSDEPQLLSKPGQTPVVCTVGRFGRYIVRLGAKIVPPDRTHLADDRSKNEASEFGSSDFKPQTSNIKLDFESIPVQAKLPDNPALVRLYRQYQQLVGLSSLLESYPRVPLPDDLAYTGSASCRSCHAAAFDKWNATAHAQALASLKKVGSDRDPECVVCHVAGLGYESGFVNEEKTPHLAGVGCENCHGPGSGHVLSAGQTPPGQPRTTCEKCHTPEQSGNFAGHEEEYMKKIQHGREPAAAGNVK